MLIPAHHDWRRSLPISDLFAAVLGGTAHIKTKRRKRRKKQTKTKATESKKDHERAPSQGPFLQWAHTPYSMHRDLYGAESSQSSLKHARSFPVMLLSCCFHRWGAPSLHRIIAASQIARCSLARSSKGTVPLSCRRPAQAASLGNAATSFCPVSKVL